MALELRTARGSSTGVAEVGAPTRELLRDVTAPQRSPVARPVRGRAAGALVLTAVAAIILMLGAAVLHVQLAERQFRIDTLAREVRAEQARFATLRSERAELRSPNRLADAARRLGMNPAQPTEFVEIDPMDLARTIAASGQLPIEGSTLQGANPLDQFRTVKILRSQTP